MVMRGVDRGKAFALQSCRFLFSVVTGRPGGTHYLMGVPPLHPLLRCIIVTVNLRATMR